MKKAWLWLPLLGCSFLTLRCIQSPREATIKFVIPTRPAVRALSARSLDCLFLNVTGDGVPVKAAPFTSESIACVGLGTTSLPVPMPDAGEVTIELPITRGVRNIELLGMQIGNKTTCATRPENIEKLLQAGKIFSLGSKTVNITGSTTVSIPNEYGKNGAPVDRLEGCRVSNFIGAKGSLDTSFGSLSTGIQTFVETSDACHRMALNSSDEFIIVGENNNTDPITEYRAADGSRIYRSVPVTTGSDPLSLLVPTSDQGFFGLGLFQDGPSDVRVRKIKYDANTIFFDSGSYPPLAIDLLLATPGADNQSVFDVQRLSNGKYFIVGQTSNSGADHKVVFAKLTSAGAVDDGGTLGAHLIPEYLNDSNNPDFPYGAVVDSLGRIIVLASEKTNSLTESDLVVLRLLSDGSRDTSFNSTGAKVISFTSGSNKFDTAVGLALQNVGASQRILVAAKTGTTSTPTSIIARLDDQGALDTTFGGGDGIYDFQWRDTGTTDEITRLLVQPDGKILIAGFASRTSNNTDYAISRLNADGTLDTSFGAGGTIFFDVGGSSYGDKLTDIALRSDGQIVVLGVTNTSCALARIK